MGNSVIDTQLSSLFAEPDGRDSTGRTPLMFAAYNGDLISLKLLLRSGASVIAAASSRDPPPPIGTPNGAAVPSVSPFSRTQ